jgi:transposase, IS30 family
MPRYAPNKMSIGVKHRYFELIRSGVRGSVAAREVGVSVSCGSVWFVEAGRMHLIERPINRRYFNQDDRIEIAEGLAVGRPVKVIAALLGKSYQSIYREIARNRKADGIYQPWYAHNQAYLRRRRPKSRRFAHDAQLRDAVAARLQQRWSPAQISRWLRRRHPRRPDWHVCPETIYEAVYHGHLRPADQRRSTLLRTGRTYRRRRGRGRSRDGALRQCTPMRSIHDRPAAAESRREIGHWEGDLIHGCAHGTSIATLVERKTRFTVLVPLPLGHTAPVVAEALVRTFRAMPAGLRRTLTWDQGNEMFHHTKVEKQTGLKIYFADPHSPWQRGTNENTNGLLRQYLPKGSDIGKVPTKHLDMIAAELNDRPRRCLKDRTPTEEIARWKRRVSAAKVRNDR